MAFVPYKYVFAPKQGKAFLNPKDGGDFMARKGSNKEDPETIARLLEIAMKNLEADDKEAEVAEEERLRALESGFRTLAKGVIFLIRREAVKARRAKELSRQSVLAGSREEFDLLNGSKEVQALPPSGAASGDGDGTRVAVEVPQDGFPVRSK